MRESVRESVREAVGADVEDDPAATARATSAYSACPPVHTVTDNNLKLMRNYAFNSLKPDRCLSNNRSVDGSCGEVCRC